MRSIRTNFIFIAISLLIFVSALMFMPKSISGFYQAQLLQNINLDHFENGSLGFGKSLVAYLILMKILHTILGFDIVTTVQLSGLASVLCLFCAYALLFHVVPGSKTVKIIVTLGCCFLSGPETLSGYVGAYATFLCIAIFSLIINERIKYREKFIIIILLWTCLGFFWHSLHVMTYILVAALLLCYTIPKVIRTKEFPRIFHFFALFTILFIFTWFILRESTIIQIVNLGNFELSFSTITSKGSFTEDFSFLIPDYVKYIDLTRYIGYLTVYVIMTIISIRYAILAYEKKAIPLQYTVIAALLVTDLIYIVLYFVAAGIITPRIINMLSIPLILIFVTSDIVIPSLSLNTIAKSILLILIVMPLIFTSFSVMTQYLGNSPEYNVPNGSYDNSYLWFAEHFESNQVVSDVHTGGQYQILSQVQHFGYDNKKIKINLKDLKFDSYKSIMDQRYCNSQGHVLLINKVLFDKHLTFGSLHAWDKYEPINPRVVSQNRHLQLVYNDDKILFYT